ncbi:hypothetical protein RRG08_063360 [Elysia crispata]|uniref:Uncharacterized protein n=1 Tax=Elysia crispata TaxID=231223 RepID=A0AAE1E8N3_9GAST|nr:hypothetical protein RRG08_063360 [Elysia crispata]
MDIFSFSHSSQKSDRTRSGTASGCNEAAIAKLVAFLISLKLRQQHVIHCCLSGQTLHRYGLSMEHDKLHVIATNRLGRYRFRLIRG